jgi:hypothetical protein
MSVCRRYRCAVHGSFSPSKDWIKDFAIQDVYRQFQETDANWMFQQKRIEHFDRLVKCTCVTHVFRETHTNMTTYQVETNIPVKTMKTSI